MRTIVGPVGVLAEKDALMPRITEETPMIPVIKIICKGPWLKFLAAAAGTINMAEMSKIPTNLMKIAMMTERMMENCISCIFTLTPFMLEISGLMIEESKVFQEEKNQIRIKNAAKYMKKMSLTETERMSPANR